MVLAGVNLFPWWYLIILPLAFIPALSLHKEMTFDLHTIADYPAIHDLVGYFLMSQGINRNRAIIAFGHFQVNKELTSSDSNFSFVAVKSSIG